MFVDGQTQIMFCVEPVDMRKHFNGLAGLVRDTSTLGLSRSVLRMILEGFDLGAAQRRTA